MTRLVTEQGIQFKCWPNGTPTSFDQLSYHLDCEKDHLLKQWQREDNGCCAIYIKIGEIRHENLEPECAGANNTWPGQATGSVKKDPEWGQAYLSWYNENKHETETIMIRTTALNVR